MDDLVGLSLGREVVCVLLTRTVSGLTLQCNMERESPRVLYVEDDQRLSRAVCRNLVNIGYEVVSALTVAEAAEQLSHSDFDVVLLDFVLPDGLSDELFPIIRQKKNNPPIIMLTGHLDAKKALHFSENCDITIPKPAHLETIVAAIERLAGNRRLQDAAAAFAKHAGLSPREEYVVWLALSGRSADETADEIGVHPGTVRTYWTRIFAKTNTNSQRDVLAAVLRHLLRVPQSPGESTQDESWVR